jgi:hypothetical protein
VTLQGANIQHWCKEESLSVVIETDDDEALACSISIGAEPPLSVAVRSEGRDSARILLSSSFELTLSEEVARRDEAKGRLEAMLERVAASRSALVGCRLLGGMEQPAVEVVVTLHGDGFTKQGFLTALAEIEKVRKLVSLEVEAMSLAINMVSEMESRVGGIVAEADKLASEAAQAAKDAEERPVPAGSGEAPPPAAAEPGPAPSPPPTAEAARPARFCASCGRQAKPEHRFCIGCGSPLEG